MSQVWVRAVLTADLPGLVTLAGDTEQLPRWSGAEFRKLLGAVEASTPQRETLVAEVDSRVRGFVIASVVAGVALAEAEIEMIAVDRSARRGGIGRALMRAMVARLAELGVETVRLEVRESNVAAVELYRSFGFGQVGRRPRYYVDPVEDALLMQSSPKSGMKAGGPAPVS